MFTPPVYFRICLENSCHVVNDTKVCSELDFVKSVEKLLKYDSEGKHSYTFLKTRHKFDLNMLPADLNISWVKEIHG